MSRVVSRPLAQHECAPGWEWKPIEPDDTFPGTHYGVPPSAGSHPRGTVWECECGTQWVSRGVVGLTADGRWWSGAVRWKREGWFAHWRRLRKERR